MPDSSTPQSTAQAIRERGTNAYINTSNIRHNLKVFKQLHPGKVIAVVKADAYGHGIEHVVSPLAACDAFAVATIDEALALRKLDANKKIMLLEGVFNHQELMLAIEYQFDLVVHQDYQIHLLNEASSTRQTIDIWLKVDSGMHRLGFNPNDVMAKLALLKKIKWVANIRLMSHFATSDDIECQQTQQQIAINDWLKGLGYTYSFSNTGAVLNQINDQHEWCRVGLGLFGISPLGSGYWAEDFNLKPVMRLSAKVIATKYIQAGDQVGYGGHFTAKNDMRVAVVGIGYADGYPWSQRSSQVLLAGRKLAVLGRVSMDMIAIDVTAFNENLTGCEVTIWGDELPIEAVAHDLNLIPYTLTCGIANRVKYHVIQ